MKLEVNLISEEAEQTLRYASSVHETLKMAATLLRVSHWHDSSNEAKAKETSDELYFLTRALDALHLAWKEAYYQQKTKAEALANDNPLYIMWYWNAAEKISVGEPFGVCKRHLPKVHVPAGRTMQRATAVPGQEISCKFCEFEEISAAAYKRRSSK